MSYATYTLDQLERFMPKSLSPVSHTIPTRQNAALYGFMWGWEARDTDELFNSLPESLKDKIYYCPPKGRRSEHSQHVALSLFEEGLSYEEVCQIVAGTPCMEKFDSDSRIRGDVHRTFGKWVRGGCKSARLSAPQMFRHVVSVPQTGALRQKNPTRNNHVTRSTPSQISQASLAVGLITRGADTVPRKPVDWLWQYRFAMGKLNIIVGKPKTGKSQLLAHIAAIISTGGRWPSGEKCRKGSVLYIQAEDSEGDTVGPRLMAAGGDLSRITYAATIRDANGNVRLISLSTDLPEIEEFLELHPDIIAILIDPVAAYLGKADSHKDAEVRGVLTPLAEMAERRGICVIGIFHTNRAAGRDVGDRIMGSSAFLQLARVTHTVVHRPDNNKQRVMVPTAQNIGEPQLGLEYHIETACIADANFPQGLETSKLVWDGEVDIDAQEAMDAKPQKLEKAGDVARAWLRARLASGPVEAATIEYDAKTEGMCWRTVVRAKEALGIVPKRLGETGGGGKWVWALPGGRVTPSV